MAPLLHIVATKGTDSGHRGQHHAAGFQNALDCADRRRHIIDELERLRQEHAVDCSGRDMVGARQVAYNRPIRIARLRMEYVAFGHTVATEAACIGVICDFQDMPADIQSVL